MPFEEAADYRFNPFDVTKVWPHADYPPITIGRLVLDRNPANHFAEVEQAAFAAGEHGPGHRASPDKMLMGRMFSYPDTHLLPDRHQLPAAADQPAKSPVHTYNKDGSMTYRHAGSQPVYAPNSYGGPAGRPEQGASRAGRSRRARSAATPTRRTPRTTTSSRPALSIAT